MKSILRPSQSAQSHDCTTIHLRGAVRGDALSTEWIVERFSPLLRAQAAYRLGPKLRRFIDPEDFVHEVWVVTLPKLGQLEARDGRLTPVLLRFLSQTLLNQFNNFARRQLTQDRDLETEPMLMGGGPSPSRFLARKETQDQVANIMENLPEKDQEILVLRGIERNSFKTIACLLDIQENTASVRYHRALQKVREQIPQSVFEEFEAED